MSRKPLLKISESEVVALWQDQINRQSAVTDSEGESYEIVYPGRPNDGRGADFRDAVVDSREGRRHGSIEIHTLASSRQAHGHHQDPVYNQVILHVALKQGKAGKTVLQNRQSVPTVILGPSLSRNPRTSRGPGLPCAGAGERLSPEYLAASLEKAGDRRFAVKASLFQAGSPEESAENLYQGFLESLGYSRNKRPFRELAVLVPLRLLTSLILNNDDIADPGLPLQAFLLGSAGFLPSQRSGGRFPTDEYTASLEHLWRGFPSARKMDYRLWELFKVRPGNHPVRRLVALSHLLYRYRKPGFLSALLGLVRQASPEKSAAALTTALVVQTRGYWANRYDFGPPDPAVSPVLLGRARAAEILVNVIFPFAFSWSRMSPEADLGQKSCSLYRSYPRLESNSIERHMLRQLALNCRLLNSARRQQGLLQIYKTLCTQGKCSECELAVRG